MTPTQPPAQASDEPMLAVLVCPDCGTDRLKLPCPRLQDECAMRADAYLAVPKKRVKPAKEKAEDAWRRLALQFDNHRMAALWHLRAMLADPVKHAPVVAEFLAAPPLSGEAVLYERLAALATPRATADVEQDAARFDFMMRAGDNHEGVESLALAEIGNEAMETDRPNSIQMRELIDAAIAASKGAKP